MKTHFSLALSFAVGLALAGCGPDATEPVAPQNVTPPGTTEAELSKATAEGVDGPAPSALPTDLRESEKPGGKEMPPGYPTGGPETQGAAPKTEEAPKTDEAPKTEDAPKTADVTLTPEEVDAIKELGDEADIKMAMDQKICPVGEEEDGTANHLGSMGKPIKETANGKTVFLCCKGCIEDFKADPEKYLAKIGK